MTKIGTKFMQYKNIRSNKNRFLQNDWIVENAKVDDANYHTFMPKHKISKNVVSQNALK